MHYKIALNSLANDDIVNVVMHESGHVTWDGCEDDGVPEGTCLRSTRCERTIVSGSFN